MVSLLATTTTAEKKLFLLKALFLCINLVGFVLTAACLFTSIFFSFMPIVVTKNGWVVGVGIALEIIVMIPAVLFSLFCLSSPFFYFVPDLPLPPVPTPVVLPPNAYELAELAVELRHVTAALAAATAEEAEGAAAAADAPPGSELQLRQQMRQQQKEILELRHAILRTQIATVEETPARPQEESPSAEVEAELARMREALARLKKKCLLKVQELDVTLMKLECMVIKVMRCHLSLLPLSVSCVCYFVVNLYAYASVREGKPHTWRSVKTYQSWMTVCLPLAAVLLLVSWWLLKTYEHLAVQLLTMRMPAEEVTVEAAGAVPEVTHKTLTSEEEK